MRPDPKVGALRGVVTDLMDTREGMTAIVKKISGVMQCVPLPESQGQRRDVLLGRLVPDITLATGTSLRSAFDSGQFVLLDRSQNGVFLSAAAPWNQRIVFVDDSSATQTHGLRAMLIRPDGVIIWLSRTGEDVDTELLITALKAWAGIA